MATRKNLKPYHIVYKQPPYINLENKQGKWIAGMSIFNNIYVHDISGWTRSKKLGVHSVNKQEISSHFLKYVRRYPYLKSDLAKCVLLGSDAARILLQKIYHKKSQPS